MSGRVQTTYVFEEAREAVAKRLSALATYVENLHLQFPLKGLLDWAVTLRMFEGKVSKCSGPCLSDAEIDEVKRFGQQIVLGIPELSSKLRQFWDLYHDVMMALKSGQSGAYAPQGKIEQLWLRIERADSLAATIVSSVIGKEREMISAVALLLIHQIRTETIEYAIVEQLEDAVSTFGFGNKYDVAEMCSVDSKVRKAASPSSASP